MQKQRIFALVLAFLLLCVDGGHVFDPAKSESLSVVLGGTVNIAFLDGSNLQGFDAEDVVSLGGITVKTRLCLVEAAHSNDFEESDGIVGFGASDMVKSASLLRTLTSTGRPSWGIEQAPDFHPMPAVFAFTADDEKGELQLGGYVPESVESAPLFLRMEGPQYGVNLTSVSFGGVELLRFSKKGQNSAASEPTNLLGKEAKGDGKVYAIFDSGTTCTLLPNSTLNGLFETSPFQLLQDEYNKGRRFPLVFTIDGMQFSVDGCVDPFSQNVILGDPWFRRYVVIHDVRDWNNKQIGLAVRDPAYSLGSSSSSSSSSSSVPSTTNIIATRSSPSLPSLSTSPSIVPAKKSRLTYNIPLLIGSPPQSFQMIFDTGSFLLAVFSKPVKLPSMVEEYVFAEETKMEVYPAPPLSRRAVILIAFNLVIFAAFSLGFFLVLRSRQRRRQRTVQIVRMYSARNERREEDDGGENESSLPLIVVTV